METSAVGPADRVRLVDDPIIGLQDLAGIREALGDARDAVDTALRHPALRRSAGAVAAEVALRTAVASAALQGHEHDLERVRSGTVTDPVLQGALRCAEALESRTLTWSRAPRQALARLHVLAARDCVPPQDLGRPTADPALAARLDALAGLVAGGTRAPALLLAAVVHGELLALAPFPGPSGVVARAAARLTLVASGLDPQALLPVDVGHLDRGPEYTGAANAFATGTRDGVRAWLRHYAAAVTVAAERLAELASDNSTTPDSGRRLNS